MISALPGLIKTIALDALDFFAVDCVLDLTYRALDGICAPSDIMLPRTDPIVWYKTVTTRQEPTPG